MLLFTAAMKQEADTLTGCLNGLEELPADGYRLWRGAVSGGEVLAVQTGIGRDRAENAVNSVLESYPVSGIISVGFGGALVSELRPGDIVLCGETVCRGSGAAYRADEKLIEYSARSLSSSGINWRKGLGITVPEIAGAEMKNRLGRETGAIVCEMEDGWIACLARDRGIPFLAVRAVLDALDDGMKEYGALGGMLDSSGNVRLSTAFRYVVSHPGSIPPLLASSSAYTKARKTLRAFVKGYLNANVELEIAKQ